jgi:hypothetical protein
MLKGDALKWQKKANLNGIIVKKQPKRLLSLKLRIVYLQKKPLKR